MAAALLTSFDPTTFDRIVIHPDPALTDDEFFALCQEHELLRIERNAQGEIIVMTPVGGEGGAAELGIASQLLMWAADNARGIVLSSSAGLTLPDGSVLSPDACWIPRERWEAVPRAERKKFVRLVPAFVIEVRSETDPMKHLREKMLAYLRNGVELGWLIDPQRRTVSIYRPGMEVVELVDPERVEGEGPVAGFVLDLKRVYDYL